MSEENENDGTWSGLKKTLIGTLATVVTAGGAWIGTTIFGGGEEAAPVQQAAPQPMILNIDNSSQNNSSNAAGGSTTIIKETVKEVQSAPAPVQQTAPVEEKVETPMERMKRLKAEKAKQENGEN
jgi:hypothetical protein